MTYSERIKELRKSMGLSQAELGSKIGFSKATVGMWEAGNRRPTIDALDKLSQLFDRSVDYILGKNDDPEPECKDSDYLALSDVADQIYDKFKRYLYLPQDVRAVIDDAIASLSNVCRNNGTLLPEALQPFKVYVGFKDEIIEREKVAPHDPVLDPPSIEEMFSPVTDEEIAEIEKHIKK